MTEKELDLLLDTCLLAGKIMMESNAEMYRVEDTMSRIALASGNYRLVSYVTQTGLFIGLDKSPIAPLIWKKLSMSIIFLENMLLVS